MNPDTILRAVCEAYDIARPVLLSRSRTREIADARLCAAYLIRRRCGLSYPQIGKLLKRSHATVYHAVREVATNKRLYKIDQINQLLDT